jgi:hypothetical protein
MMQLNDEPRLVYKKWDLLERKERPQLEKCSRAQKLVTHWSGESWGFYGCFNSGLSGFFSLAMDSHGGSLR